MQSLIKVSVIVCLASLTTVCVGREAAGLPERSAAASDANDVNVPSFPYAAEITGDDVYIRSGPGTNYYHCGKLNKGDQVKVVGSQFRWSCIVPPSGSFSWISKEYVTIDQNNPSLGSVSGDAVRVYAGSDDIKPIHSTTMQGKLNRSDKVKLMGQETGGYYKIEPPAFAYLWVSSEYIKPLGPIGEVPATAVMPSAETKTDTNAVVPTKIAVEAQELKKYYALEKQIDAERAKPISEQNYADIKKALDEIANNKDAGKAARYSQFAIKQIESFELAWSAAKEVQRQNTQLEQIKEQIDKACAAKLAEVPDLGKFAVIGQFQTSNIYGPEPEQTHYRIIDDSGKTICYALPSGPALQMTLNKFIGRKVGLVGTIEPHPQTGRALVRFTEITELK
jgi:uncharacterized protein YgiM (DUF1202 family)